MEGRTGREGLRQVRTGKKVEGRVIMRKGMERKGGERQDIEGRKV